MRIYCRVKSRSSIGSDLDNHTFPCMEALVQLYLFWDTYPEIKRHWAVEVWSHFAVVDRLKRSHKFPNSDFIYKNTWKFADAGLHKVTEITPMNL